MAVPDQLPCRIRSKNILPAVHLKRVSRTRLGNKKKGPVAQFLRYRKTWKLRRYYQSGGNSYVDGDEQYDKDLEVEAILPEWWEQRKIDDRREFCVNHQTQMTQWVAPKAVNLCALCGRLRLSRNFSRDELLKVGGSCKPCKR